MAVVNCRICGRRTPVDDLEETDFRCDCGNIIPVAERSPVSVRAVRQQRFSTSSWSVFDWFHAIRWVFGGILCIAIGILAEV